MRHFYSNVLLTILSLATARSSIAESQRNLRKLQSTAKDTAINFDLVECVDYNPDDDWSYLEPSQNYLGVYASFEFDFLWFDGGVSNRALILAAQGSIGMNGYGDYLNPYYADLDFNDESNDYIAYRDLGNNRFTVVYHVGNGSGDFNIYQAVISGTDLDFPQVCYCYKEMNWVSSSSQGIVGVNPQSNTPSFLLGQFNAAGTAFNGVGTTDNGVEYLNGKAYCFDLDEVVDQTDVTEEELLFTIDFDGDGCVDYSPDDDWSYLIPSQNYLGVYASLDFDFLWFDGDVSNRALILAAQGSIGMNGYGDYLNPYYADTEDWSDDSIDFIAYRDVGTNRFAVVYHIGNGSGDFNTYQAVISVSDSEYPQVCFCYKTMNWVSSSSQGIVGVNPQSSTPSFLLGQFNVAGTAFNGVGTADNGVEYLNGKEYCFDLDEVVGETDVTEIDIRGPTSSPTSPPSALTDEGDSFSDMSSDGNCLDSNSIAFGNGVIQGSVADSDSCKSQCSAVVPRTNFVGVEYEVDSQVCRCLYDSSQVPSFDGFSGTSTESEAGTGYPATTDSSSGVLCSRYNPPVSMETSSESEEWIEIGMGSCRDSNSKHYDTGTFDESEVPTSTLAECQTACYDSFGDSGRTSLVAVVFRQDNGDCKCFYEPGSVPEVDSAKWLQVRDGRVGTGIPVTTNGNSRDICYGFLVSGSEETAVRSVDCESASYNFQDSDGYGCDYYEDNEGECDYAHEYENDDGCHAGDSCEICC